MAIAFADLTTAADSTGGTSQVTASISPSADALILAWVGDTKVSTNLAAPTLSGNGLTWVQVATQTYDANGNNPFSRLTLFRAMGASPSAGAVTISTGAESMTGFTWSIVQVTGTDTSGTNGSGAVVQSATNFDSSSLATSLTVTLSAFSSASNATAGGFVLAPSTATLVAGSGFTIINQASHTAPNTRIGTERLLGNDTTVDVSWSGVASVAGIAAEIKSAEVGVNLAWIKA